MDLHIVCVGEKLYVVVPIGLMLGEKVTDSQAYRAIVVFYISVRLWFHVHRGHVLRPHPDTSPCQAFGDDLRPY